MNRCPWPLNNPLMIDYHDTEWGVPLHDDNKIYEFMLLDAFQAGLSWAIILNKREGFRQAFANFDPSKIAQFGEKEFNELVNNPAIIRNKSKINASIINARQFLKVKEEFGSFDKYIWQFTGGKTIDNNRIDLSQMHSKSIESDVMSKDLLSRGFKFVGSTICYAFMQAAGMVNDHLVSCFRYEEVKKMK